MHVGQAMVYGSTHLQRKEEKIWSERFTAHYIHPFVFGHRIGRRQRNDGETVRNRKGIDNPKKTMPRMNLHNDCDVRTSYGYHAFCISFKRQRRKRKMNWISHRKFRLHGFEYTACASYKPTSTVNLSWQRRREILFNKKQPTQCIVPHGSDTISALFSSQNSIYESIEWKRIDSARTWHFYAESFLLLFVLLNQFRYPN